MATDLAQQLTKAGDAKIVLLVLDGLGGLPDEPGGETELEQAATPNLDRLAREGVCGLHEPIAPGITPGSGPAHLALFGYDPVECQVGRGMLAALGVGFDVTDHDVAMRGNFCTVDDSGAVTDRRAGRISTEKNRALCEKLRPIKVPEAEVFIETVKEHRFLLVLRADGLDDHVTGTDPQVEGREPLTPDARTDQAQRTATMIAKFLEQARELLADEEPANMVLLRGVSKRPHWPTVEEQYGLDAASIAVYPMYRGVARLIGMNVLDTEPTMAKKVDVLERHFSEHDFFYMHVKRTDSAGEDSDRGRKIEFIERADREVPRLMDLEPNVIVVTGDHSTPAALGSHSWHPVPTLLWSKHCRTDRVEHFGERACITGALGPRLPATELMPLMLANALRLRRFGA
jgi:2,3-bisphosphoglycerate-independent phosphoglycerate mutase